MNVLLVIAGAAVGAPLRYVLDRAVQARHDGRFPWGTFVVNISGCLVLGCLTGAGLPAAWTVLAGTGFCGAFTTYSTFSYETVRLTEQRAYRYAIGYTVASVAAGLVASTLGYAAAHALLG
ncbi:fluoride efflux transporter CrcB [Nocardia jinanensis]|uniref:Fluoride-specific ion channel FluC n=1 Tax=Nocardia jinanensis TaxID=382504 RepID=A0A917S098_9NOCA|nr:fluoride efflux transporter CrcB [Nocardia jinanensis]GGL46614.1 putative fluoride ion transporter CrcB 2 [Nocardia jinanensis]